MSNNWDLSKIYKDQHEINSDIKKVQSSIETIKNLSENPKDHLKEILDTMTDGMRRIEKLYVYSHMKKDEDSQVMESQKLNLEMGTLYASLSQATSFFEPWVLSLSDTEIDHLLGRADLDRYLLMIKKILRLKSHTLSDKEEYILSSIYPMTEAPENDFYMLKNTDIQYPMIESAGEELSEANYSNLLMNKNRTIRKESFDKMYETMKKYNNTFGSTLYNNVNNLVILSKLRHYHSAREMELFKDDVSETVYDILLDTIERYLPSYQKYFNLKRELLGLEEAHMYDIYAPVTKGYDEKIPFEKAREMVIAAVEPLGEEYQNIMRKAFDENWIDVYPRKGKRPGAYSSGMHDTDPYILLNYTDDLDSVFTLIHELGHSIHSYYSRENNDYLYSGYTIFVAEVASTFNELLLLDYLLKHADSDEKRLYLLDHHIHSFKSTVFRQSMFAEFEKIIHETVESGQALTGEGFNTIYYDLNVKYFGESVVSDEAIQYEWSRIPHFYSNFYVYKYATGFSAATILSQKVLNHEEGALDRYISFLRDGNKNYPLEQLKIAGADIQQANVLEEAFLVFQEKVDALEKIIKERRNNQ